MFEETLWAMTRTAQPLPNHPGPSPKIQEYEDDEDEDGHPNNAG